MQSAYALFVPEGVAGWVDDAPWRDGEWRFAAVGPRPIHHLKGACSLPLGNVWR